MTTHTDGPDVLEELARLRPSEPEVAQAWDQNRRLTALERALATGPSSPGTGAAPRARRRTSRWIGAGIAAAAAVAAALLLVPGALGPEPVPAVPAPVGTTTPPPGTAEPTVTGEPVPTTDPEPIGDLAALTVSTAGWKTFSSPEYPITVRYPADWELHFSRYTKVTAKADQLTSAGIVDGCGVSGCAAYVSPPGQNVEGGNAVVLMRNGFQGYLSDGRYDGATVLATLPELSVWTPTSSTPSAAAIVTRSADGFCVGACPPGAEFGPPYEYMLSTTDLATDLAVGDTDPLAKQLEAAFSIHTTWGPEGEEAKIVATILASSRPNPDFHPTQPAKDRSGRYKFWVFDPVARPGLDTDVSTWRSVEVPDGNVRLRVPPTWTISDDRDGIMLLEAPSGYLIAVLTNGRTRSSCRPVTDLAPSEKLATLSGISPTDVTGTTPPVELWWQDATWLPAQVWLQQVQATDGTTRCSQTDIDYGGVYPVHVGSADNLKNPTGDELTQAAAILGSLEPIS